MAMVEATIASIGALEANNHKIKFKSRVCILLSISTEKSEKLKNTAIFTGTKISNE